MGNSPSYKNSTLTYHLAEALTAYIYATKARLEYKTDLLAFLYSTVAAMVDWKTEDRDDTAGQLEEIESDISWLEDHYEPCLDELPEVFEKKTVYRSYQRMTLKMILTVIRKNDLLSNSVMREVNASKWGSGRKGGDFDD